MFKLLISIFEKSISSPSYKELYIFTSDKAPFDFTIFIASSHLLLFISNFDLLKLELKIFRQPVRKYSLNLYKELEENTYLLML